MSETILRGLTVVALTALAALGWEASAVAQTSSAGAAPLGSKADVEALRERAAEFWAARVSGDFQAQWELMEPRGKGRITSQEYGEGRGGLRYLAYQVEGVTITGFFAQVNVRVLVQPVPPSSTGTRVPAQAAIVDDGWVRIRGVWYRRLEEGQQIRSLARQP